MADTTFVLRDELRKWIEGLTNLPYRIERVPSSTMIYAPRDWHTPHDKFMSDVWDAAQFPATSAPEDLAHRAVEVSGKRAYGVQFRTQIDIGGPIATMVSGNYNGQVSARGAHTKTKYSECVLYIRNDRLLPREEAVRLDPMTFIERVRLVCRGLHPDLVTKLFAATTPSGVRRGHDLIWIAERAGLKYVDIKAAFEAARRLPNNNGRSAQLAHHGIRRPSNHRIKDLPNDIRMALAILQALGGVPIPDIVIPD